MCILWVYCHITPNPPQRGYHRVQGAKTAVVTKMAENCIQGGGGGGLRGGIISPWDISQRVYFACSPEFAVGNSAPICCELTFGGWWLLLLTDALQLSPRGLLFLPDELLVAGCCYFMVVAVISW